MTPLYEGSTAAWVVHRNPQKRNADSVHCAQRCLNLVRSRCDELSGRYLELSDDIEAMLREAGGR